MKKTLVALAALASVSAFAQSSVTISGRVDLGLIKESVSYNFATAPTAAQSLAVAAPGLRLGSANGTSRIQFAGVEDLGGGMAATFVLQQRFNAEAGVNDGSTGGRPTFQGESSVGLRGAFGAVRLGRALTALQLPVGGFEPWGTETTGSVHFVTNAYSTDPRTANSGGLGRTDGIFYNSPNFSGFNFAVSIGLKQGDTPIATANSITGSATAAMANGSAIGSTTLRGLSATSTSIGGGKNLTSLYAGYANGPLSVGIATETNRDNDKLTALFGSYNLGVANLMATTSKTKNSPNGITSIGATTPVGVLNSSNFSLGATIPFGAAVGKVGYARASQEHRLIGADSKVTKFGFGMDYNLSKRTKFYTDVGITKLTPNAIAAAALGTATGTPAVNGRKVTGIDFGVNHNF